MSDNDEPQGLGAGAMMVAGLMTFVSELGKLDLKPRTVQHKIDGLTYTNRKVTTDVGLELMPRVAALLGAAFAPLITGDTSGVGADTLVAIANRAMRDGLSPIARDLMREMQCNVLAGDRSREGAVLPEFGEHFAGEYLHLLKVCVFSMAHNFRGPTLGAR